MSFFEAVARNEIELVDYMLRSRAEVNVTNVDGMTPLHFATDENIANALILNGANINAQNNRGSAPLHWAVSRGKEKIVQLLLEYGANPNISDVNGNTPLHWAAKNGDNPIILQLIRKGADVNSTNASGSTPLLTALANGNTSPSQYLTMAGAREISNQQALAPTSFLSAVTSPDLITVLELDNIDPLIRAIFTENYKEAESRITAGSDLNLTDINGNTALHWAFTKQNRYISKLLLDKGANINAYNNKGSSPADLLKTLKDTEFEKFIRGIAGSKIIEKKGSKGAETQKAEEIPIAEEAYAEYTDEYPAEYPEYADEE